MILPAPAHTAPRSLRALLDGLGEIVPNLRPVAHGGASLEVAFSNPDKPETRPTELLEDDRVRARPVATSSDVAFAGFLDGIQESRTVAYAGTIPIVYARLGAVIRTRVDHRLVTWDDAPVRRTALYAPWQHLAVDAAVHANIELRDVRDDAPNDAHPFLRLQNASKAVKQDREALERDLAERFCLTDTRPLYIDGGLPPSQVVKRSPQATGVVKSHHTLFVNGRDLEVVLGLTEGQRSSVFVIDSRRRPAVASWYLRLRNPQGQSPFWGLVRVEAPLEVVEACVTAEADARSGWILAERSPVALPDGRWDTMAYGIRNCEEYLRATITSEGVIRGR